MRTHVTRIRMVGAVYLDDVAVVGEDFQQGFPFRFSDGGGHFPTCPPPVGGDNGGGQRSDGGGFMRDSRQYYKIPI